MTPEQRKRAAELATQLGEERFLGRKVATLEDGFRLLEWELKTEEGRATLKEAWRRALAGE